MGRKHLPLFQPIVVLVSCASHLNGSPVVRQTGNCNTIHLADPQGGVQSSSFPRIFGLPVHAYLVNNSESSTHIWSTFTHKWSTNLLHHADFAMDTLRPIYLYELPIWIACSSSVRCGNCSGGRSKARTSAPSGERRLRRSARDSRNMRRRGKKQHAVSFDLNTQRGIHTANAPEGIEDLCTELGAALRSFGIPGAEAPA